MHLSISQLSELTGRDRRTVAKQLSDLKHTAGEEGRDAVRISRGPAAFIRCVCVGNRLARARTSNGRNLSAYRPLSGVYDGIRVGDRQRKMLNRHPVKTHSTP
jgi:hypothetical protein